MRALEVLVSRRRGKATLRARNDALSCAAMRPGESSRTAALVCMARAIAHEEALAPKFSDPTALHLLSEEGRARVERHRRGPPPRRSVRGRVAYEFMTARAAMMAVRTVFIDEAVREAAHAQVVILGAGLDGRAWRMPELRDAVVFEVDHPDTQRTKRARIGELGQTAREVRFVAVDFTRDDLAERLAAAGHDATKPTTWIWEGVVMYLTPAEVEASLAIVAARSAPGSRLVVVYTAPGGFIRHVVALAVRRLGEPFRSTFREEQMRALLAKHGFGVVLDEGMPRSAARIAPAMAARARRVKHVRMVTADRA
jgi:methyltransferase (TIGR00027 family)